MPGGLPCSTPFGITEVGTLAGLGFCGALKLCSTPFGITEVGTDSGWPIPQPLQGAQRLSASLRWALCGCRPGSVGLIRAQRLSASLRWAQGWVPLCVQPRRVCSTPFGITEVGTSSRLTILVSVALCSTPFGITEVGTIGPAWGDRESRECSTPFGITEVGTTPVREMLSALLSAQRLSASLRWARQGAGRPTEA